MRDFFANPDPRPPLSQRGRGELLGRAARILLIAAAAILVVGGLALVAVVVIAVVSLNSWGSNK